MQTFLPYASFAETARCLDNKRLGKQRVEVLQILNALTKPEAKGWKNHPATLMWKGHEGALVRYGVVICEEWTGRGFRDTVRDKLLAFGFSIEAPDPGWIGDERIHASHRASLLRKDNDFYRRHGWTDDPDLPYHWPVSKEEANRDA
jgi:hypothetical protein